MIAIAVLFLASPQVPGHATLTGTYVPFPGTIFDANVGHDLHLAHLAHEAHLANLYGSG